MWCFRRKESRWYKYDFSRQYMDRFLEKENFLNRNVSKNTKCNLKKQKNLILNSKNHRKINLICVCVCAEKPYTHCQKSYRTAIQEISLLYHHFV